MASLDKVIGNLTKADEILAKVIIKEKKTAASSITNSTKKKVANGLISQADNLYALGETALSKNNPTIAIGDFGLAWVAVSQIESAPVSTVRSEDGTIVYPNITMTNNLCQNRLSVCSFI